MERKPVAIWVLMLATPMLLWGFVMAYHWLFSNDATSGTAVNDNLLNIGMSVTVLGYFGAIITLFLYPLWIFMLIRAVRHNKKMHKTGKR